MKYVFLGIYYLGWWSGWSAPDMKIFDNYEDCSVYFNEMNKQLDFCQKNNCYGDWPST